MGQCSARAGRRPSLSSANLPVNTVNTSPGFDALGAVADAILYEGYLLYPYRRSSPKNRVRWQFGILAPRRWLPLDVDADTSVSGSARMRPAATTTGWFLIGDYASPHCSSARSAFQLHWHSSLLAPTEQLPHTIPVPWERQRGRWTPTMGRRYYANARNLTNWLLSCSPPTRRATSPEHEWRLPEADRSFEHQCDNASSFTPGRILLWTAPAISAQLQSSRAVMQKSQLVFHRGQV